MCWILDWMCSELTAKAREQHQLNYWYCFCCCLALDSYRARMSHLHTLKERKKDGIGSFFKGNSSLEKEVVGIVEPEIVANATNGTLFHDISNDNPDAEIMFMVDAHFSYRSCDPVPNMFKRMFKTYPAAPKFQMKKDKSRCITMYSLYCAFKTPLEDLICLSLWFSVLFE